MGLRGELFLAFRRLRISLILFSSSFVNGPAPPMKSTVNSLFTASRFIVRFCISQITNFWSQLFEKCLIKSLKISFRRSLGVVSCSLIVFRCRFVVFRSREGVLSSIQASNAALLSFYLVRKLRGGTERVSETVREREREGELRTTEYGQRQYQGLNDD